jgi:cell division septum initiation protein DivIVA
MSELDNLVNLIEERSKKLVKRKNELSEENSMLKTKLAEMQSLVEEQKRTINELKDKHQVLKIAKTIEDEDDSKESIKQLNFYIKEIDRCIALLNS